VILSRQSIKERIIHQGLLSPWVEKEVTNGVSAGLSHAGYELRLSLPDGMPYHYLEHGETLLAASVERFKMPNDLMATIHDKSTMARQFVSVFNSTAEPGWEGYLTIEIVNHSDRSGVWLTANQGIAQVVFHLLDKPTSHPYAGKYNHQEYGPQGPRFEGA